MKNILTTVLSLTVIVFIAGCATKEETDAWVMWHHQKASIISTRNHGDELQGVEYALCEDGKVVIVGTDMTNRVPVIKTTITLPPDHVSCK
jgi:hypothetical protein